MGYPFIPPIYQFEDGDGDALSGGKLYSYENGTVTKATTYSDAALTTANSNPIILNSRGEAPAGIFLEDDAEYKFILKDENDATIWTMDDIRSPMRGFAATSAESSLTVIDAGYPPWNVLRYGAKTDGTDNRALFQSILDAVPENGTITFPSGNYTVSNSSSGLTNTTDDITLTGGGKLVATDDAATIITNSGDNVTIDGLELCGNGSFTALGSVASDDRIALIKNTGDHCTVQNCVLTDGPQNFVHFHGTTGGRIANNILIGGITTYDVSTDTGYQGIRCTNCEGIRIESNFIKADPSTSGKTAEGIYLGPTGAGVSQNNHVAGNRVEAAWDHGIYHNVATGGSIINNTCTSDSSAIVAAMADASGGNIEPLIVNLNECKSSGSAAASDTTPGLYLRDCNSAICTNNVVSDFPRGIYLSPVTYNGQTYPMSDNIVSDNVVLNWTQQGVMFAKAGKALLEISRNQIRNNILICDTANVQNTAAGISSVIGQEDFGSGDVNIANENVISGNVINSSGDAGVSLQYHSRGSINNNVIIDPTEAASPTIYAGIFADDCDNMTISDNLIRDTNGTANMRSGIDGNSGLTESLVSRNRVINQNTAYTKLRRIGDVTNSVEPYDSSAAVAYAADVTLDPFDAKSFRIGTLTGNINIGNPNSTQYANGLRFTIILEQDGTGSRSVTWESKWNVPGSVVNTAADAITILEFISDGVWNYELVSVDNDTSLQAYTETNVSTDRSFDADTVAVAELADVVGTLIVDLRAKGIVD